MLVSLRKESATWTKLSVKRPNTLRTTHKRLFKTSCSNGIMRSDEDGACLGECGNSNGATHVVGEDSESGAVRDHACGTELNGQSLLWRNEKCRDSWALMLGSSKLNIQQDPSNNTSC